MQALNAKSLSQGADFVLNRAYLSWPTRHSSVTLGVALTTTTSLFLCLPLKAFLSSSQSIFKMANPPSSPKFDWKMFRYTPTLVGAIVSLVIFLIMALLHLWQLFKLRQIVIIYIIIGAFCEASSSIVWSYYGTNTIILGEVAGYGSRISCHFDNAAWGPFIVQGVFLLVGPLFFAATIYMMLGRTIVLAGGESVSLIKPTWYTRIFITADISTLVIQALGA
jgi:hypothetical protein